MILNLKKTTLLLAIMVCMTSCIGQNKSLSNTTLLLEKLDFSTPISILLPEDTRDTIYDEMYNVKNTSLQKFVVKKDEYEEDGQPIWIEYRQFKSRSNDQLAEFANLKFNTFNMVTSLDGKIMVFNAIADDLSNKESDEFIQLLNRKYGVADKTEGDFINPFEVYTWKLQDRVLKYVPLYDNESNTLKIVIDKDKKTLEAGEKNPHYKGLFYVINAKYSDNVIGKFHTGELLYCQ